MDKNCIDVKRSIFTGTPGSGKTSVIQELERNGYDVIHEAATDVISDSQLNGIQAPWEYPDFIDAVVFCQKERQGNATGDLQFYDRSPFCTYALAKYLRFDMSDMAIEEIDRCVKETVFQKKVFFFENLGYVEPSEARKISYEEALIFEQIHLDVYKKFGFEIVIVPRGSVEERCQFILNRLE